MGRCMHYNKSNVDIGKNAREMVYCSNMPRKDEGRKTAMEEL
jgi:hypothetical protein